MPVRNKYKLRSQRNRFYMPKKPKQGLVQVGSTKLRHGTSKSEEVWLSLLGVPERSKAIHAFGKIYIVDGFDPKTRTIYEYLGDFYHAYPPKYKTLMESMHPFTKMTYRQTYEATKVRLRLLSDLGFKIIYAWESDFKKNKFAQKQYIPGKELI